MLRSLLALAFLLLLVIPAAAENREPPRSWQLNDAKAQPLLVSVSVPGIDALQTRKDDLSPEKPGTPLQFASPRPLQLNVLEQAEKALIDGFWVARLAVQAKGATDLNLHFSHVDLPAGARLHIYDAAHDVFQGPLAPPQQQPKGARALWTPVVPTGSAVIEVSWPKDAAAPTVELAEIWLGYRDLFGYYGGPFLSTKAGACNNDVVCAEGDPWRDEIRSVARYTINGGLCTGTLVNDATTSLTPYFLTAYHCGVDASSAANMVFYWNFESSNCGDLSGGSLTQNQSGSIFRARRQDVDMALVELSATPAEAFNVHYAGWDRSGDIPTGTVGIHHPAGDEKAISFSNSTLTNVPSCIIQGATADTHWEVPSWDDGTTEPGSSGSGIWHPTRKRVIGFLSGGRAACGNSLEDCYGRMDAAWDGADAASRLRDWLDPGGVSPATGVDGTDPTGFSLAADPVTISQCTTTDASFDIDVSGSGGFTTPVTLSVSGEPTNASTAFSVNPVTPGGSSALTLGNLASVAVGDYSLTVSGSGGGLDRDLALSFSLQDGAPGGAVISSPTAGAVGVSTQPTITWNAVAQASSYQVQIAENGNFASPVVDQLVNDTQFTPSVALASNSDYSVRVRASNTCGDAPWSDAIDFTTAAIYCSSPALGIPDNNATGVSDTIAIANTGVLDDLNLSLSVDHTWVGDLIIRLSHQGSGTSIDLVNRNACNGSNINVSVDDQASASLQDDCQDAAIAYPESSYRPQQALAAFDGQDLSGDWQLFVSDNAGADTGTLQQWCLAPSIEGPDPDIVFADRFEP